MAILGFIVGGAVLYFWGLTKQRNDAVNLEAARAQAEEITKGAQTRSQLVVKEAELKAKDMVVGAKADAEREMRDRRREIAAIEQKLEALTAQADISCAIDVVDDMEAGGVHKLDLDWFMQLKSQIDDSQLERRRERVQVEMRQFKGVWKITALSPITIFDPLKIR